VGKIVHDGFTAWARRALDFAHADSERTRAFAHPTDLHCIRDTSDSRHLH